MLSSAKALQNKVTSIEEESDRKISHDVYYIVWIKTQQPELAKIVKKLIKKLIKKEYETDGFPLLIYSYGTDMCILFSSLETGEHFMKGSHQKICSYFASIVSRLIDSLVICSIVEFDSRPKILIYFQTKIYENAQKSVLDMSEGKLTHKNIQIGTLYEAVELLKQHSIFWEKLIPHKRFGTLYKYQNTDKKKLITLSELIDVRFMEKYNSYFFG